MENASKALIIAGAILLAIVIISLGLIVINNTRGTVDSANMNEQEIQAFNAKFTPYEGKITGTRARTLIQTVIAVNNNPNTTSDKKVSVKLKTKDNTNDDNELSTISSDLTPTAKYNVNIEYKNSLVNLIKITD